MHHLRLWVALATISPVFTEIVPVRPTEEEIFSTGEPCLIQWDADTSPGGWKTMRIGRVAFIAIHPEHTHPDTCTLDLMSGTPPSASVIENVAESVGTTDADPNTFSWTCPPVDSEDPVYSYMVGDLAPFLSSHLTLFFFQFTPMDSLDPPEYSSHFTVRSVDVGF